MHLESRTTGEIKPKYIFNIIPCAAPRMTQSDKWRKRSPVLKYLAFKDEFVLISNLKGFRLAETLKIAFIIPMPICWSIKKRKKMEYQPHQQKPDIDNLTKSVLDAFGKDDGFVYDIHAVKYWGNEGKILIY